MARYRTSDAPTARSGGRTTCRSRIRHRRAAWRGPWSITSIRAVLYQSTTRPIPRTMLTPPPPSSATWRRVLSTDDLVVCVVDSPRSDRDDEHAGHVEPDDYRPTAFVEPIIVERGTGAAVSRNWNERSSTGALRPPQGPDLCGQASCGHRRTCRLFGTLFRQRGGVPSSVLRLNLTAARSVLSGPSGIHGSSAAAPVRGNRPRCQRGPPSSTSDIAYGSFPILGRLRQEAKRFSVDTMLGCRALHGQP